MKIFLFISLLLLPLFALPQKTILEKSSDGLQFGITGKMSMEFAYHKVVLRLGLSAGIGIFLIPNTIYGSMHFDFMAYNNGLGSPKPGLGTPNITTDFIGSTTLSGGFVNRLKRSSSIIPGSVNYPLYYFGNFNREPLQNPFNYSLSLGSDEVFSTSRIIKFQRVGFLNVHIDRIQISYFNDGTPFGKYHIGDGYDRYYTGGGILSFNGAPNAFMDIFELSYYKFTGYQPNSFEIANALNFSYNNYHDPNQYKYNKSEFSFNVGSSSGFWSAGVASFNSTRRDVQHIIHKIIFNGYHRVPYDAYLTPSFSISFLNNQIGIK